MYTISRFDLQPSDERWGPKISDWDMRFTQNTHVGVANDDGAIPQQRFAFVPIEDLSGIAPNALVDVIGVVTEILPVTSIITKKGAPSDLPAIGLKLCANPRQRAALNR